MTRWIWKKLVKSSLSFYSKVLQQQEQTVEELASVWSGREPASRYYRCAGTLHACNSWAWGVKLCRIYWLAVACPKPWSGLVFTNQNIVQCRWPNMALAAISTTSWMDWEDVCGNQMSWTGRTGKTSLCCKMGQVYPASQRQSKHVKTVFFLSRTLWVVISSCTLGMVGGCSMWN